MGLAPAVEAELRKAQRALQRARAAVEILQGLAEQPDAVLVAALKAVIGAVAFSEMTVERCGAFAEKTSTGELGLDAFMACGAAAEAAVNLADAAEALTVLCKRGTTGPPMPLQ